MLHIEVTQADITKARKLLKSDGLPSKCCPVAIATARKQKKTVSVGFRTISLCNGHTYTIDEKGRDFIYNFDAGIRVRPIKFTATLTY